MLIIVCGLQGVGKTIVAKKIAEKTSAILLKTDVIRKELIKNPTYSEEEKTRIYDEMLSRAKKSLRNNTVILDATFAKKQNILNAMQIAEEAGTEFIIVEVKCSSEEIIKNRLQKRFKDESDAEYKHYLKYKKTFEPITKKHIVIDNSGEFEEIDNQINNLFKL